MRNRYIRNRNRKVRRAIAKRIFVDRNRDLSRSILLAGAARSGTTWVADLISYAIPARILFEPFFPEEVPEYSKFHYYQYMRVGEQDPKLYSFTEKLFSGKIRNSWVDKTVETIFPQVRVIKAVRANLCLRWIGENFPDVPIVLIMRHPCAVTLSRLNLGWAAQKDLDYLLAEPKLVDDLSSKKMDIIESAVTEEEKQAVLWSLLNYIPLKQFARNSLNLIYYEDLVLSPEDNLQKLYRFVGLPYDPSVLSKMSRPSSTTTSQSAILNGNDGANYWKSKLSRRQISEIMSVVDRFELDYPS
jgi:hypothetical protein